MNNCELSAIKAMRKGMTIVEEGAVEGQERQVFDLCMAIVDRLIWLHDNGRSEYHVIAKNGVVMIDDNEGETLFKLARP